MPSRIAMGLSSHLIRIHPDNAKSKDWVILLEAGTIVGPSPERLRVARSTLDRKIVKKYNIWLQPEHFLFVEGYDPRIHAVYFSIDRKSTRLNSSHRCISYAVFCLKKKKLNKIT